MTKMQETDVSKSQSRGQLSVILTQEAADMNTGAGGEGQQLRGKSRLTETQKQGPADSNLERGGD